LALKEKLNERFINIGGTKHVEPVVCGGGLYLIDIPGEAIVSDSSLNRRDFNRLTVAALGGAVAGTAVGAKALLADDKEKKEEKKKEAHVCRGLNSCKGNGGDGKNACAGQGICATVKAHTCGGQNACKNQGGCGETPGENACKGKGKCHVPLNDKGWEKARARFEERMTKSKKKFGPAPAKPKKKAE
jgi:hypothetical protein